MSWFQSFPSAVQFLSSSTSAVDALLRDCELCFNAKQTSESYSAGSTFFIRADETPKCTVERLAMEIFAFHTRNIEDMDRGSSGAEWWVLRIDPRDDVGFHWDRDYGLEERGEMKYPHLATVTYLSAVGGATIVTGLKGKIDSPSDIPREGFSEYAISSVLPFKHIAFRGDLLHGAPSEIYRDEDDGEEDVDVKVSLRITFLVNIWVNHLPQQPNRLSYKMHRRLSNLPANELSMAFSEVAPSDLLIAQDAGRTSPCYHGDIIQGDQSYRLVFSLPPRQDTLNALEASDSLIVRSLGELGHIDLKKSQTKPADSPRPKNVSKASLRRKVSQSSAGPRKRGRRR